MCTVTMILPQEYPGQEMYECIRPLAEPAQSRHTDCFLGNEKLVWQNNGFYFLFSCQPRQLTLYAVSDYNPLISSCIQPLDRALNSVAMDNVERVVIKRRKYEVKASTGNLLLKELRRNLNNTFICNRYAVKNYYGPLPGQKIDEHYMQLIAMAEQAIINPEKLILITSENESAPQKTLVVIDRNGAAYKCRLTNTLVRIAQASPPRNFSIHDFRNSDIKITSHCLERFVTRILGRQPQDVNPFLAEGQLLKFIKNKAVHHSYLLGRTAILNVAGYIFIGILSQGRLNLVTTYRETRVDIEEFHRQLLQVLRKPVELDA